jgi:hypothetical protein
MCSVLQYYHQTELLSHSTWEEYVSTGHCYKINSELISQHQSYQQVMLLFLMREELSIC